MPGPTRCHSTTGNAWTRAPRLGGVKPRPQRGREKPPALGRALGEGLERKHHTCSAPRSACSFLALCQSRIDLDQPDAATRPQPVRERDSIIRARNAELLLLRQSSRRAAQICVHRLAKNWRNTSKMSAQDRNDTPPSAGDTPSRIRHHCHTLGLGGGVKGRSRRYARWRTQVPAACDQCPDLRKPDRQTAARSCRYSDQRRRNPEPGRPQSIPTFQRGQ